MRLRGTEKQHNDIQKSNAKVGFESDLAPDISEASASQNSCAKYALL